MDIFDFSYKFPSTIEELDQFSGKDFEVFLFEFFKAQGFKTRITDDTYDKGIDLIVEMEDKDKIKRIGIQAKRWKSKVGANEIRSMLDGKEHYNLDEAWIITTSDLTSAAITTAKNNRIEIINREYVKKYLAKLKTMENVKFRESQVKTKPKKTIKASNGDENSPLYKLLVDLRIKLAKKHESFPVYLIYNNETIDELVEKKPKTLDELKGIKGFSDKKIELFGAEIIHLINTNVEVNPEIKKELIEIRRKIYQYNKLENQYSPFNDSTLYELAIKLPTTLSELSEIRGMNEEKIKLFGNYLISQIALLLEKYNN